LAFVAVGTDESGADATRRDAAVVEQRLSRLQRVAGALSVLLTPAEVADVILREAAPELGGISRALWLLSEAGTELELVDPARHERAAPFASIPIGSDLPGAVVTRTAKPIFLTTRAERDAQFPALAGTGPQVSIAVLPLTAGGGTVGVLACSYDEEHAFADDERRYLLAVSELASQALERSRLHARQVEVARALQSSLLPPELPTIAGIDLAAAYHPAWEGTEVGGDFYDVFPLPGDGGWAFTIGDVCGTGPAAAAVTAQARHTVRAVLRTGVAVDAAMALVNDTLVESLDAERFCTMILVEARTSPGRVELKLIAAGHPAPLVVRAAGGVEALPSRGALVGAFPGRTYAVDRVQLGPGDVLVLYTDGVVEARSAAPDPHGRFGFFGDHGLLAVLEPLAGAGAAAIVSQVEQAVIGFSGTRLADDVAVLAIGAV
jgi:serine phosphatase RsbU (regulator of sigma subunit)